MAQCNNLPKLSLDTDGSMKLNVDFQLRHSQSSRLIGQYMDDTIWRITIEGLCPACLSKKRRTEALRHVAKLGIISSRKGMRELR